MIDAPSHGDEAVGDIDIFCVDGDFVVFVDELQELLEVFHGLFIVLLIEETATDVVVQFKTIWLVLQSQFVFLDSFVYFSHGFVVVAETGMDHRFLLLVLYLRTNKFEVFDRLVVFFL